MDRDSRKMRGSGPYVFARVTNGVGVQQIADAIIASWKAAVSGRSEQS
jgi:urease accessory protein